MNSLMTPEMDSRVNEMLESAKTDLTRFRKELGQDMVSVQDRYSQLKKELLEAVRDMKAMLAENKAVARAISAEIRQKLDVLETQVQQQSEKLSESELAQQLANIKRAMTEVVRYLGTLDFYDISLSNIQDRLYRYRIKFAILKLKLQLGSMQFKEVVMDAKVDWKKKIHEFRGAEERIEKRWKVFQHEIAEAYEHLQKAFTSK